MKRTSVWTAAAIVLAVALVAIGVVVGQSLSGARVSATADSPSTADRNEFRFQVDGYRSKNRGGQTSNLYFFYRYNSGIADADIPDFRKLRTEALGYLDGIDPSQNLFLEQINKVMCTKLKQDFPIEAISCQTQVLPEDVGVPNETGARGSTYGSTYTIGDIDSLDVPGPLFGASSSHP